MKSGSILLEMRPKGSRAGERLGGAQNFTRRTTMLNPRALTHAQLAEIVADVQAILWEESRMLPDFPRECGRYWNPAKE